MWQRKEKCNHGKTILNRALLQVQHEALSQISLKAVGYDVGGRIGIARYNDHVSVAVFFGIGLLHLDEVAIGLGHRVI